MKLEARERMRVEEREYEKKGGGRMVGEFLSDRNMVHC